MKYLYNLSANFPIRIFLPDTGSIAGGGRTGLNIASSGLRIAEISDNEAAATVYTGSNLETITTLGTWVEPSVGKCRFREVDANNLPGVYEVHISNARQVASFPRSIIICIQADGIAPTYAEIELLGTSNNNALYANIASIFDDTTAAYNLFYSSRAIARGVVAAGSTTTVLNTTGLTLTATDQLKGRVLIFDHTTPTAALRWQAAQIVGNTAAGVLTVSALTVAPASGDFFGVY
jgi:hypothetical protein